MASQHRSIPRRIWKTLSSVATGITLLILTVIASAAGTFILQRPLTDPEQMLKAYSPATLRWLDAGQLTDVFHSWWFVSLLALLCLNIVFASLERFPTVWRYFSRPYRRPDAHFLTGLPLHVEIPVRSTRSGVEAAERAFRRLGMKPQHVGSGEEFSLYAERHRFARLAAYVVHLSLLLILGGGIVDAIWGYRGYMALTLDDKSNAIDLRDGTKKTLPFTVRCDGAGQENYADGSPRRWWSRLAVLEDGREVKRKEIEVNEPLVYRGLRFFQSGYGSTGQVGSIRLLAVSKKDPANSHELVLHPGENVSLDGDTEVRLAAFVPDLVINGNQIESRSDQPNNPAIQLAIRSKAAGDTRLWLFANFQAFAHSNSSPYDFKYKDLAMGYFTGLQVSYEPGQWAVWAGCILMGIGLMMAFYFVHIRYWAVPVNDGRGRLVLWVGAAASKNREQFEERFRRLVREIEQELKANTAAERRVKAAALVGA
ncbi:MAG: cytochrome c biogenesis protein ResB [Acidobacteria bacterium]|nr:cytochrome c biogenesis protein ResB [Acidobacteriota bacterium]MBI3661564.1 cytochrome c biogenesis protein ResB [Acidobacteriota bacterium]